MADKKTSNLNSDDFLDHALQKTLMSGRVILGGRKT